MATAQAQAYAATPPVMTYTVALQPMIEKKVSILRKQITYLHGEPLIVWEEEKVSQMFMNEDLQYAVIRNFAYGWLDIHELR